MSESIRRETNAPEGVDAMGKIDSATAAQITTFVLVQKQSHSSISKEELRQKVVAAFPNAHISKEFFKNVFDLADGRIEKSVVRKGFEGPLGAEFKNVLANLLGVEPEALSYHSKGELEISAREGNTYSVGQAWFHLPAQLKEALGRPIISSKEPGSVGVSQRVEERFQGFDRVSNPTDKGQFFYKSLGATVTDAEFEAGVRLLDVPKARQSFRTAHLDGAKDDLAISRAKELVAESAVQSAQDRLFEKDPPVETVRLKDGTLIVGDLNTSDANQVLREELPEQTALPSIKAFEQYVHDLIPGAVIEKQENQITIRFPAHTTPTQESTHAIGDVCKKLFKKDITFAPQTPAPTNSTPKDTTPFIAAGNFKAHESILSSVVTSLKSPADFKQFQAFLRSAAG